MAASEPWLTLRRSYEISLAILTEPGKEVHVAIDDRGLAGFLILDLRGPFTGYIQTVCVEPARRGCGVGRRARTSDAGLELLTFVGGPAL